MTRGAFLPQTYCKTQALERMLGPKPLFNDGTGFNTVRSHSTLLCILWHLRKRKGAGFDNLPHCFDYDSIFKLDKINLIIKRYFNGIILLFLPNLRQLGLLS